MSNLTNQRVYQELVYRNGSFKEMITGSAAPSLPSFLPFYFRVRALSIQQARLSWSMEQATSFPAVAPLPKSHAFCFRLTLFSRRPYYLQAWQGYKRRVSVRDRFLPFSIAMCRSSQWILPNIWCFAKIN